MKQLIFIIPLSLFVFINSCKEKSTKTNTSLSLGDSTTIVTEYDSNYLVNNINDISPVKKQSAEKQITSMMVQVDSLKASQKLENETDPKMVKGFEINFNECKVIFDGLTAHALNLSQNERNTNSVSYLKDAGNIVEMKLFVDGLQDVKVEQRVHTKLYIIQNEKSYLLNDLGKYISPWFNLASKENTFVSVSNNSAGFFEVNQQKIKNAFDRELRKKKMPNKEIAENLKLLDKTNLYSDAPCIVKIVSSQWRIIGKRDGKRVQKLIQLDEPQS